MPVELSCEVCGDSFSVKPHREESAKYCSPSCQHNSMEKQKMEIGCDVCGDQFYVKPSRADTAKYCSKECMYKALSDERMGENAPGWKGGRLVSLECEFCGNTFKRYQSEVEHDKPTRFCSASCRHNHLSEKLSEPGTDVRASSEYRKWRKKVKERDGKCVECGSEKDLHAHHIVSVEEDESLATDIENGVTLCADCHSEEHPEISELIRRKPYNDG